MRGKRPTAIRSMVKVRSGNAVSEPLRERLAEESTASYLPNTLVDEVQVGRVGGSRAAIKLLRVVVNPMLQ
jgi:hypothetical protein